jgi:Aldo/keto reductase family
MPTLDDDVWKLEDAEQRHAQAPDPSRPQAATLRPGPMTRRGLSWTLRPERKNDVRGLDMRRRRLGRIGIEVSAIGLGCWGMSGTYGPADEQEFEATLLHALDLGMDLIDTADFYGEDGHNESLMGRVLKDRLREFVLATKTGWVKRAGPDGKEVVGVDGRPERIRSACEASLGRLLTDHIDLYYLH